MNNSSKSVYVIAEMASSHQGDVEEVYRLIDGAKNANVDCLQVQIFNLKANASSNSKNYQILQNLEIKYSDWKNIIDYIEQINMEYSVFTYDEPSLDYVLANFKPNMIKFNSSELSNPKMLEKISNYPNIKLNLGTGGSSFFEIDRAINYLKHRGFINIFLAHGIQNFPTEIKDINFPKMKEMINRYDEQIIFADHTDFKSTNHKYIDYIALGMGIKIFEKHFILQNNSNYIDNESSLNLENLEEYVNNLKIVNTSLLSNKSIKKVKRNIVNFKKIYFFRKKYSKRRTHTS